MLSKKKLLEFCQARGLFTPPKASKEYLERVIVRAALHESEVDGKACFGLWQFEDSNCAVCDHEKRCFETSIGMPKDEFFKALERMENPRLRLKDSLK